MKNFSNLHNWFLVKYPDNSMFSIYGHSTEHFYKYFALPTDVPVCLFGNTYDDTRANKETTEFADGHRLLTGDLIDFTPAQAETKRSIYTLHTINPQYSEWLKEQGYSMNCSA